MKEQHILFINMPALPISNLAEGTTNRVIKAFPFGILYLSSVLKKRKHRGHIACVDYLVLDSEKFKINLDELIVSEAISAISPYEPDVLAFSFAMSTSYEFFERCLPILKKTWPNATVIVGGMHASNTVKHLFNNYDDIDYVVAGEAEEALPLLLSSILEKKGNSEIDGVHSRDAIQYNPMTGKPAVTPCIVSINDLPFPDWSIINVEAYAGRDSERAHLFWDEINADNNNQQRGASLFTSRGCPYCCTFCAASTIHGRKMRLRDPQNVVEEMRQLNKNYGISHFHIYDDLPLPTAKRTHELLKAMNESRIENLKIFFTQTFYINTTSEEIIDAVIDYTGISTISFAVESASPVIQKSIRKNVDIDKAARLIRYAQSKGLIVTINIILGFPEETKEQMQETISCVKNYLKPNWTQFHIATPVVGAVMYDQFIEAGCIIHSPETWKKTLTNHRYFDSPWITADLLNELRYRANLECNFVNNYDLQCGNYGNALDLFRTVIKFYPFHIFAWDGIRLAENLSGNDKESQAAEQMITKLILNDSRSRNLLKKYGDLFPEVVAISKSPIRN